MVVTASNTAMTVQLGVMTLLVARALSRRQLTAGGVIAAIFTGLVHALHPWRIYFVLLIVFFIAGNVVTKVKHTTKSALTTSATGSVAHSAPPPRTAAQVFCNSLPATLAVGAHWLYLDFKMQHAAAFLVAFDTSVCLPHPRVTETAYRTSPSILNALPYAVFAHYAAAAADTFASELGILSSSEPLLVTRPWSRVPRGTNGGVSLVGLLSSALGAAIIGLAVVAAAPFCKPGSERNSTDVRTAYVHGYTLEGAAGGRRQWMFEETLTLGLLVTAFGVLGGLLDSVLGALLQASVVDARTGKVVEGAGGAKVKVDDSQRSDASNDKQAGRRVLVGRDVLSNNGVNLLMSALTAALALAAAAAYMGSLSGDSVRRELQFCWELLRYNVLGRVA